MECRICRAPLEEGEGEKCADTKACGKRSLANMKRSVATMKQIPLTAQRQQQLYNEAMGKDK